MRLLSRVLTASAALLPLAACGRDPAGPASTPDPDRATYDAADTLFASVATAATHSCGLTRGGRAFCWGDYSYGALGAPPPYAHPCSAPGGAWVCSAVPVAVTGGLRFARVAVTQGRSCGLTPSGRLYCWWGGLAPVALQSARRFVDLDVNDFAELCAVGTDGRAYCWNLPGSAPSADTTPVAAAPVAARIVSASQGCGVTDAGALYCWQSGPDEARGYVDTTLFDPEGNAAQTCTATAYSEGRAVGTYSYPCYGGASRLRGGTRWARMARGSRQCALATDGQAYCWGFQQYLPGSDTHSPPTPIPFGAPTAELFASYVGTLCALGTDGVARCLMTNGYPGDGTFRNAATPAAVPQAGARQFMSFAPLGDANCGVTPDGSAWCWGGNARGQVGADSAAALVPAATRVASIAGLR